LVGAGLAQSFPSIIMKDKGYNGAENYNAPRLLEGSIVQTADQHSG
jgi:hypothetical protein